MTLSIRRSFICLVLGFVFTAMLNGESALRNVVENSAQTVRQEDRAFVQAAAKRDSAAVGRFLDAEFTWTNAEGKTSTRAEVLSAVPASVAGDESGAQLQRRDYGQVIAILSTRDKIHVLRIWTKRGANWRLLVYHEVSQAQQAPVPGGTGVKDCENPCKTVPFHPKNEAEQSVIASWQALETGVTNHDASAWSPHVDEEFVTVSSSSDHPVFKADRIATLNLQKQTGYGSAPAPLVSAQMVDFPDTIVMTCLHQPYTGKSIHVTRVWIKREGKWVMSISFQTTIQASVAKS